MISANHVFRFCAGVLLTAASAHAQWSVVNLHSSANPPSSTIALGVHGGQQVGSRWYNANLPTDRALLWNGTAESAVDLTPGWAFYARATGAHGGRQIGTAGVAVYGRFGQIIGFNQTALLWEGTTASLTTLTPPGATGSSGAGIFGNQQVGSAIFGGTSRAGFWNGTADSWVDLHPAGAAGSGAAATSGTHQVGTARIGGASHAGLWSGSAATWVDLHPAGADESSATTLAGDFQGGFARIGGFLHAGVWHGTAESWVNLHPAGAIESEVLGMMGDLQVGYAKFGVSYRAGVWHGTAESWTELHDFLPATFSDSQAWGIWSEGNTVFVAGGGSNSLTNNHEAMLWTIPAPGAGAVSLCGIAMTMLRKRRKTENGEN